MTPYSIDRNTSSDVDIHIVRPYRYGMQEHGCTGFTNVRFTVPELCRRYGHEFGIYLDVDMLVLGDIADLWTYRQPGKWITLKDGTDEVSVISAQLEFPPAKKVHTFKKWQMNRKDQYPLIPMNWNVEDRVEPGMSLLHFTNMDTQPWFYDHPNQEAVNVYNEYKQAYERDHLRYGSEPDPASD